MTLPVPSTGPRSVHYFECGDLVEISYPIPTRQDKYTVGMIGMVMAHVHTEYPVVAFKGLEPIIIPQRYLSRVKEELTDGSQKLIGHKE